MAGACGCESCCQLPGKALREGLKGSGAGKRQARTPLKTDGWGMWLRELLPAGGFEGFEGGQTAGSNGCCQLPGKGLREGLKGSGAGKRQARTPLKTDGWGMWLRELLPVAWERPAGGFEGWKGLPGQARTPFKTDGWGVAASRCCQLPGKGLRLFRVGYS